MSSSLSLLAGGLLLASVFCCCSLGIRHFFRRLLARRRGRRYIVQLQDDGKLVLEGPDEVVSVLKLLKSGQFFGVNCVLWVLGGVSY